MDTPLNPSILDHLRLAHVHIQEAEKLLESEMGIRPRRYRHLLDKASRLLLNLHAKEATFVKRQVEEIYRASKY